MKTHALLKRLYILKGKLSKRLKKKNIDIYEKKNAEDYVRRTSKLIKKYKNRLYEKFPQNSEVRKLDPDTLSKRNIIAIFDSVLSRTLNMDYSELNKDIIVVQTYFFQILEDLIKNGFIYEGEKYVCFTASAGQIRTKKTIFLKESLWKQHQLNLMCGLTIDSINEQGGMNINKFLAYLALCNSATNEWKSFNIHRSIVVDDLETDVKATVDYIDKETFEIKRKRMNIPIAHTDGCGMILPKKSKRSFMCRLPWIKGLLVPFPFDKFKKEGMPLLVKDIYGKTWDIERDKIEVIFTRSQFKMAKYYSDWKDYKEKFIKYQCQAAKCNEEESEFAEAKLNYQMVQSLTSMSSKELETLATSTIEDITNVGTDKQTMLKILGVTDSNTKKNYTQQGLEIYNELLNDQHSREIIKNKKKSLVKEAKAAKLNVNGTYTFICPDLYAFCEKIFWGIENPNGLLNNGEVYCDLYKDSKELDCLRSPHLFREHAVRKNSVDDYKGKWFITSGLYTSVKDPISKILMFDCDGDKSLVCADKTLIKVAKRDMNDIYPLYYEMAVANKEDINSDNIYKGLVAAYKGGNIGTISNDITKIWNSDEVNIDAIKWLCMINNFVIDYAKTLFLPEFPDHIKKIIRGYTKKKVPHFFIYAKDKEIDRVENLNDSIVNKLDEIIPNPRINFKKIAGKFNSKNLMENAKVDLDNEIINRFEELDKRKKWIMKKDENNASFETLYAYKYIRDELLKVNDDAHYITDVLVKYLYEEKKSTRKKTLWESFGDILVSNLKRNLDGTKQCESCGKRIKVTANTKKYCEKCFINNREKQNKEKALRYYHKNKKLYQNEKR